MNDLEKEMAESYRVAEAMRTYGGSFVKALGEMLQHADAQNRAKVKATWPEYWDQYEKMSREDES